MAGITAQGLTIKRQGEVLTDLRNQAQTIFQDLVPPGDVVDTGDSSTIGRITGLDSIPLSDLWEAIQQVYLAFDPNSAYGVALDNLVAYAGLTRNPASATTATLVLWGNENLFLPALSTQVTSVDGNTYQFLLSANFQRSQNIGFRVAPPSSVVVGQVYSITIVSGNTTFTYSKTAIVGDTPLSVISNIYNQVISNSQFTSSVDGTTLTVEGVDILEYFSLSVAGLIVNKIKTRVEAANLSLGEIPQDANTIINIATPVLGWDSVNNPFDGVVGEEPENDDELRVRFRDSKFRRAQNIGDALYAALIDIDGVVSAGIFENDTDTYNTEFDLPPHSFKPVILGGDPSQIATAIWRNKPLGISSEGNTIATIFDSQGFQRDIHFERPVPMQIYIDIDITVNPAIFPSDGATQIRNALINYFQDNVVIGSDVIYSRLYTPINSVAGHQVNSMQIGTTSPPTSTTNIVIPYNGLATLNSENINITIS